MVKLSTLCYIEQDGKYLMLHRTVKENDINKDKWIGVGGHFEKGESPEECLLREVWEETGYTLTSWRYRGIVTFVYGEDVVEYMSLYTADGFTGTPIACDEGELEWPERVDQELVHASTSLAILASRRRLEASMPCLGAKTKAVRKTAVCSTTMTPPVAPSRKKEM